MTEKQMSKQYDEGNASERYTTYNLSDPVKEFVHYSNAVRLLGDIEEKRILDIGCGSGRLARMLASRGAKVIGYDSSIEQLKIASEIERNNPLGIKYLMGDFGDFGTGIHQIPALSCDKAVAMFSLMYAKDQGELELAMGTAAFHLKEGGKLVGLVMNPEFKRFGILMGQTSWTKISDGKIDFQFYDSKGEMLGHFRQTRFSYEDYEGAAREDFSDFKWEPVIVTPESRAKLPKNYLSAFRGIQPNICFTASKK